MPAELPAPGSAADWLRHARSDLSLSQSRKTKTLLYQHLCFHAQQAAEKALKAVLVRHGLRPPRSHDLSYLMDMLPETVSIPPPLVALPVLTKYAVQQRYPGENSPLTASDRRRAVVLADESVRWASRQIRSK